MSDTDDLTPNDDDQAAAEQAAALAAAQAENAALAAKLAYAEAGIDTTNEDAQRLLAGGIDPETAKRLLVPEPAPEPEIPADEAAALDRTAAATSGSQPVQPAPTGAEAVQSDLVTAHMTRGSSNGVGMNPNEIGKWLEAHGVSTSGSGVHSANFQIGDARRVVDMNE